MKNLCLLTTSMETGIPWPTTLPITLMNSRAIMLLLMDHMVVVYNTMKITSQIAKNEKFLQRNTFHTFTSTPKIRMLVRKKLRNTCW